MLGEEDSSWRRERNIAIRRLRYWFISLAMKAGAVDTDQIQGKDNSFPSCRVSGSVTFLLVAAYFYFGRKHVKPVCYLGTPSMYKTFHQIVDVLYRVTYRKYKLFLSNAKRQYLPIIYSCKKKKPRKNNHEKK